MIGGKNDPTFDVSNIGFIRLNDQQFNLKDIDHDGPDYKARGINVIRVDAQSCEIQASKIKIMFKIISVSKQLCDSMFNIKFLCVKRKFANLAPLRI